MSEHKERLLALAEYAEFIADRAAILWALARIDELETKLAYGDKYLGMAMDRIQAVVDETKNGVK